jgi:hypothetical protein
MPRPVKLCALALAAAAMAACHDPENDYTDYLARRGVAAEDTPVISQLEDLSGRWIVHALLAGGLDLGLRFQLAMNMQAKPITVHARIWLMTADPTMAPPLVETDSIVQPDGTFGLNVSPLVLTAGSTPGLSTEVRANVILMASTLRKDYWCGTAEGTVQKPLVLDLMGSTFAARPDDGKIMLADVPQSCVPHTGGGDGGVMEIQKPDAPDLSAVHSSLADISGHWILNANLAGSLPLKLWASLVFTPGPSGGSLDGALRRATDPPGSPALQTFTTTVSADGRFEVWLPSLVVGTVQASVLLEGATEDMNGFCGAGAGHVQKPISLALAGTTFAAVRWTPGTPLPDMPPDHCP